MNIGQLKKAIKDIPDDVEIVLNNSKYGDNYELSNVKLGSIKIVLRIDDYPPLIQFRDVEHEEELKYVYIYDGGLPRYTKEIKVCKAMELS